MSTHEAGSALYFGWLAHTRFRPNRHAFRRRVAFMLLDLDEIPALDRSLRLFSHNRFNLYGIRDRDHLGAAGVAIRDNVIAWLAGEGIDLTGGRVRLMTNLRTLGYVFNPVSFYHCDDASGRFRCAIAEVTNTFGERRAYLLDADDATAGPGGMWEWATRKEMHVSPFFPLDQRYRFMLGDPGEHLVAKVDLHDDEGRILTATQSGTRVPLTDRSLLRLSVRYPFVAQQVIWSIHLEALRLWRKGVPFHRKPAFRIGEGSVSPDDGTRPVSGRREVMAPPPPPGPRTPGWIVAALSRWALRRPSGGHLTIHRRDLTTHERPGTGPLRAEISIHSPALFRRILRRRRVGIGEAYVAGDWDAEPLADAIAILMMTGHSLATRAPGRWIKRAQARRPARAGSPARSGSQDGEDIVYHYDLGNDLYALFLDPSMTYSCGVFTEPGTSLEAAQREKYRRICAKLELGPDDHVLEIGCGWGAFAVHAATHHGCRVTALTLSPDQHRVASDRVAAVGLGHLVEVRLEDYRATAGRYDKIASIEMLEAVGAAEHRRFFQAADRLLTPDGRMCIQVITIADERWERYRRTRDWIQTYIFPGATVPSLGALRAAMEPTRLRVAWRDDIGPHYATTLRLWRERFEAQLDHVRAMGFSDTFIRSWRFYLASCEAGFATGALHDLQILVLPTPDAVSGEADREATVRPTRGHAMDPNGKDDG